MPTVSAIITSYNAAHLLPRTIGSIQAQTVAPDEILIVDDASQDDPVAAVAPFGDAVRLLRCSQNGGPSAARNHGAQEACGEWIAFLDADDQWVPQKLEKLLEAAAAHPEAKLIYSDCLQIGPDGKRMQDYHSNKKPVSGKILDALIEDIFILPSSMMIRRQALLDVGGFDESLRGAEDMDLYFRLSLAGASFQLVPELLVIYERQPESLTRNHIRMLKFQAMGFEKLLKADLTPAQRARARHRLAGIHFDLGYRMRSVSSNESLHHAALAVQYRPANFVAWKLLAGNSLRRFM